jgi:hypothetical protein
MRVGDLERLYDYNYRANRKLFGAMEQVTPGQWAPDAR